MSQRLARKVLLIGWDAADWKIINPLLDAGKMPALEKLVNKGVIGNLATLDPPMSPMLWTSIATGKHADKHGILGFTEPAPQAAGVRPVLSTSRKVKAIWNILSQKHLKTNVVGWWPSHPAEPINGISVSNFYHHAHNSPDQPWPMQPGTVYPKRLERTLAELRIHPAELTQAHILPFVPKAAEVDQEKDKHLNSVAKIIAECSTIQAAATWIMENEDWDFMGIYFDAVDHFCHGFMNFHPPRMKGVPKKPYEFYKDVVTSGYRFHDMMLERLIELAGEDTTVILISDHGFHSDHLRPKGIPKEPAGPAWQHRPYGIFCMKGPHIRKDERISGARLLDITPTILTLFGLPVGRDMDGHPLMQAFDNNFEPEYIPSWEDVDGECGMHPPEAREDPHAAQEAMDQLIALGYIEKPDKNKQKAIERTVNESNFYLARVYIDKGQYAKALPLLEKLYEKLPDQTRYAFHLAKCYQALNQIKKCRKVVDSIIKQEKKKNPQIDLLQGTLALAEKRYDKALLFLFEAEKAAPRLPSLHQQIGKVYLKMHRWEDAERAFITALSIDPDSAIAYEGLAEAYLWLHRYADAAGAALDAVGLLYHFPKAHFNLGVALSRLKHYERAAEAFEVAVAISPGFVKARRQLIRLYEKHLTLPEKADIHRDILATLKDKKGANS